MTLTLEDLGNIGDFIGGIAVIVTLLYLAFQMRQNTKQLRQNADLARLAGLEATNMHGQQARSDLLAPGAAELYMAGLAGEDLSPADRLRFELLVRNYLYGMQGIFLRTELLDDGDWPAMKGALAEFLRSPGAGRAWRRLRETFREDFRAEADAILAGHTRNTRPAE